MMDGREIIKECLDALNNAELSYRLISTARWKSEKERAEWMERAERAIEAAEFMAELLKKVESDE